jgi:hypothetical protein
MFAVTPEELIASLPDARRATARRLRQIVLRAVPDAIEQVRPGWGLIGYRVPAGRRQPYFGGVWPEPHHVHLLFEYGVFMNDPHRVLVGSGKRVRWITLERPDELPPDVLRALVREAADVAAMSRSERLARALDRPLDDDRLLAPAR